MTHDHISDDALDALFTASKVPIVDDGFSDQTLARIKKRSLLQAAIPLGMGLVGAAITAAMLPHDWFGNLFADVSLSDVSKSIIAGASSYGLIGGLFIIGALLAITFAAVNNHEN